MANKAIVQLPPKLVPVFTPPRGAVKYRGAYGGRGSAKSASFATMAAVYGYAEPLKILCTREFQNSIKDSFHAELKTAIERHDWLNAHYEVGEHFIKGKNGTEFIFKGLRRSLSSIKSTSNVDLCIVEEAEDVPEPAWRDLTPTIRSHKSEIWVIWNPRARESATDIRYKVKPPPDALIAKLNYDDNPWFVSDTNLEQERLRDLDLLDPNTYAHIWEGEYLDNSDSQILGGKWSVKDFTPGNDWDGPYHGLDFGFSQDPTAATKSWIHDNRIWVEYESGDVGIELDHTAPMLKRDIKGIERFEVIADNARPESISYLKRHGIPRCKSVRKWAGSVEDGIAYLRSYKEIVIHSRCKNMRKEARLYSYKVDDQSGQVLDKIIDANNHYIDSLRYAHDPMIKGKSPTFTKVRMA